MKLIYIGIKELVTQTENKYDISGLKNEYEPLDV